jgi:hypothetical protein
VKRSQMFRLVLAGAMLSICPEPAAAQFFEPFDSLHTDPAGLRGWSCFTGDGQAAATFEQQEPGVASIRVDATGDRRNIWWALIKHKVSDGMDLSLLSRPGYELRVETRIRVSHAPRRVNLHLNTQRTTDFHSHLMEFDIPETDQWHTISLTTRDFDARPGDTVFGQMALMDWGLEQYSVDVDYFRADVVEVARAGPDVGVQVPYHPPIPDSTTFRDQLRVAHDSTIDVANPDVNLNNWSVRVGERRASLVAVGGTLDAIMRFDVRSLTGRVVDGAGLLELTTSSVQRTADSIKDFGLIRVVEILGGDPDWDQKTVTADSLHSGQAPSDIFNSQMIIDWPATEEQGGKTYFTISRPVLQRLIDGRTLGLALRPLGSIMASFYSMEHDGGRVAPRLLLNLK